MENNWFWHGSNLNGKIISPTYMQFKELFKDFIKKEYNPFQEKMLSINGNDKDHIQKKLIEVEKYYDKINNFIKRFPLNKQSNLRSQAKLRPTILEEFCCYLFKDMPEMNTLGLGFFNKKIFAGLGVDEKGNTYVKTKDVDCCIGKKLSVDFSGNKQTFIIPIIAIECKTYVDKTMFSEAQFTAQTLKRGSPNVRVYILAERNEVALSEIPSQTPIDQYFVLRGGKSGEIKPIDLNVLWDFFQEIRDIIRKTTEITERKQIGRLIID